MRRTVAVLTAVICLLSLVCGCARTPKAGEGFRFPLSGEPRHLDPQTATDEAARTVIDALFEGLTTLQNGVAVPAAADWSVMEDGRVYVFALRESAWSDGTPVTADDFVFALERMRDPVTASPYAAALDNVHTAETIDAHTLRVTLHEPDEQFPETLAAGVWYPCPRAFFAQCGGGWGMEPTTLLQNGAFTLSTWEHGKSLLLKKNEGYHAAAEIAPAAVRFVIGAEQSAASLAAGTLDGCALAANERGEDITVTEVADTITYLWFNNTVSPLVAAEVRVRLRDAIEWETVNTALVGTATVSYVSAAAQWHGAAYESALPARETRADRAAWVAALSAQGLSTCPALTLLCADDADSTRLAQYIVQSWQKHLSVYFTIETVPAEKLTARLTAGNYHIALAPATARGDSPADALLLFDGTAADGNWARYTNADWAASVRAADTPTALQAAEEALAAACPAVPLSAATRRFGLAGDVVDVQVQPFTGRFDFRHAKR